MEDGGTPELRRMMVEYGEQFWRSGWAPLYGVLGGNPLAAMPSLHFATSVTAAHVLAETGARAGALGWTYTALLGTALVYLGEHYVVDLVAGLALAEGVRAGAPAATPLARRLSAAWCRRSRRGRAHERRRPLRSSRRTPSREDDEDEAAPPRLQLTGRNLLILGGFLAASLAALYYLLPQLAGLQDTWHRIEDGSPYWMLLALLFTLGMFGGYVMMFRGVFVERREPRADRLARELPDHDGGAGGVADLRRGRRGRARADGLGAAAGGHAQAAGRRQDAVVPDPHLLPLRGGGDRLRLRPPARHLPRRGAVRPHGRAGDPGGDRARHRPLDRARADRPAAARRAAGPRAAAGSRGSRRRPRTCPPRRRPACATRSRTCARATRRCSARSCSGRFQILVLWAAFQRVRRPAAVGGADPGVLRRHARQPAADAGRRRRRGGRHDRRRSSPSASTAAWPSSPCSSTVRFTFWLPLIPGVIAYFQLRKTVERWSLHYTK